MLALVALGAGLVAGRVRPSWRGAVVGLDRWVIRVALPALILAEIPDLDAGAGILVPAIVAWSVVCLGAAIVLCAARLWHWPRATTGMMLLVVPLGNTSFLGIPAVELLLGPGHVSAALAYDQLGSFLALAVYGGVVVSRYGEQTWTWASFGRRLATFTPLVAMVLAAGVRSIGGLPDPVDSVMEMLGSSVAPVALASLGLRLRLGAVPSRGPVAVAVAVRLLVLPSAALCAAMLLGDTSSLVWQASVLEAAMPPMVTAGIVAAEAGLDGELASSVVGWGTLVGLGTVALWGLVLV